MKKRSIVNLELLLTLFFAASVFATTNISAAEAVENSRNDLVLNTVYEAENLFAVRDANLKVVHDSRALNLTAVYARAGISKSGCIIYGPYTTAQKPGQYRVFFRLKVNDNSKPAVVAKIDAYHSGTDIEPASRQIHANEFRAAGRYQDFRVDFTKQPESSMEYRLYWYDQGVDLWADRVSIFEKKQGGLDGIKNRIFLQASFEENLGGWSHRQGACTVIRDESVSYEGKASTQVRLGPGQGSCYIYKGTGYDTKRYPFLDFWIRTDSREPSAILVCVGNVYYSITITQPARQGYASVGKTGKVNDGKWHRVLFDLDEALDKKLVVDNHIVSEIIFTNGSDAETSAGYNFDEFKISLPDFETRRAQITKFLKCKIYQPSVSAVKKDRHQLSISAYSARSIKNAEVQLQFNSRKISFDIEGMDAEHPKPVYKTAWIEPIAEKPTEGKAVLVGNGKIICTEKIKSVENVLRFAVIGDPHFGLGTRPHTHTKEIIDDYMNNPEFPNLDFVVNMGDTVHFGKETEWKVCMNGGFNALLLPWMYVFGNHDTADYCTGTEGTPNIYSRPYEAVLTGKRETGVMSEHYGFIWDNILFLVIGDEGNTMLLTDRQRDWLEYMTNLYRNNMTILMSHEGHNGRVAYRHYNNTKWWARFIADNPQVKLHIHGHNHQILSLQCLWDGLCRCGYYESDDGR